MSKQGYITAVGLGPGDAELLTLKGYKALKKANVIYYPASSVDNDNITSFSLQILNELDLNIPLKPMHLPMNSKDRLQYYRQAYNQIKQDYQSGMEIAIVSEGDILFYSTFGYLLKHILEDRLNYTIVPGIPAFIATGTLSERSLVEGNTSLKIISCPNSFDKISSALKETGTLVIMKLSRIKNWGNFYKELTLPFLYAEQIGTERQFFTNNTKDLIGRRIPYFSILIIYNKDKFSQTFIG
jgi:precorrin-2/cobalt-factor-2 C20-methyltransferase